MRITKILLLTLLLTFSFQTSTQAEESTCEYMENKPHPKSDKFGRGMTGMILGFLEIPGNVVNETQTKGLIGLPLGLIKGAGMLVGRELVGVYEFISAPLEIPACYRPILTPEYSWEYFVE
jgi:putative exosortase-associated protein (TIGR04073 family)